jgi:uncharacterized protein involved in exopolysaccharide biosynthesis
VLDTAQVPEIKIGPNRKRLVVVAVFAAAVLGVFLAFFLDYLEKVRKRPLQVLGKTI